MKYNIGDIVIATGKGWRPNVANKEMQIIENITDGGYYVARVLEDKTKWYVWDEEEYPEAVWTVSPMNEEYGSNMRYLIAVEGHRNYDTYFIDITPEFLQEHPDVAFKMGEIVGLYLRYTGEES